MDECHAPFNRRGPPAHVAHQLSFRVGHRVVEAGTGTVAARRRTDEHVSRMVAAEAMRRLETGHARGKVVVTV